METIIALLALFFFLAFIIGLFKPSVVKMPSRKRAGLIYLGGAILLSVLGSSLYPPEKIDSSKTTTEESSVEQKPKAPDFEYADLSLGDFRNKPQATRHKIVKNYVESKEVAATSSEEMYSCASEFSFTKSAELNITTVLGWCYAEYQRAPADLSKRINFDTFQGNFSAWDGSYRPLEKLIKESMNDDSSYDHVSTVYSLVLNKDPHAVVKSIFRGKNGFGAIMKSSVAARVNIQTGAVEKIIEQ